MKGNILKYCFILVAFIFSCTKEHSCDCFKGTGDTTTEFRKLLPFNKISIENNINLYITEDTVFYMTVEAGSKLISSNIDLDKDTITIDTITERKSLISKKDYFPKTLDYWLNITKIAI